MGSSSDERSGCNATQAPFQAPDTRPHHEPRLEPSFEGRLHVRGLHHSVGAASTQYERGLMFSLRVFAFRSHQHHEPLSATYDSNTNNPRLTDRAGR